MDIDLWIRPWQRTSAVSVSLQSGNSLSAVSSSNVSTWVEQVNACVTFPGDSELAVIELDGAGTLADAAIETDADAEVEDVPAGI